ncbi:MAG: hypothetical protein P8X89_04995 [Reinekea sp.]
MLPKNFNEPMGAPAIFEKQIEIKLLHPASTPCIHYGVTDSGGSNQSCALIAREFPFHAWCR